MEIKKGKSRVPPEYEILANRLRELRISERFSQDELAREVGTSRSSLANYEFNQARLPFGVGLDICRRLDVSPRWLATGTEPKRPFLPLDELGITEIPRSSRLGFLEGYDQLLKGPISRWLQDHSDFELVKRTLDGGIEALARRLSMEELEVKLVDSAAIFRAATGKNANVIKKGQLFTIEALVKELKARHRI